MDDPDGRDTEYIFGLDLGQSHDPSALVGVQKLTPYRKEKRRISRMKRETVRKEGDSTYHVTFMRRFDLGTPYTEVARQTAAVLEAPQAGEDPSLVVDAGGVGAPVIDQLKEEDLRPYEASIIGRGDVKRDGRELSVPKMDLATSVQILLQGGRLKVAEDLPLAEQLTKEMKRFRVKITDSGHARFEHATESDTDDLVIAAALALWFGEEEVGQGEAFVVGVGTGLNQLEDYIRLTG